VVRRNAFRRAPVRRLELGNTPEPEHVPVPGSARVNVPDCQAQMVDAADHQNYSRRSRVSSTDWRYVATCDVSHDCGEVHRRLEPSHARLVPHRDRLPGTPAVRGMVGPQLRQRHESAERSAGVDE